MIICIPGSYRHLLLLTVRIMVGALCCWFLMSVGTARAQSDPPPDLPASATPTDEGLSGQLSNLFNYHYGDPGSGDHLQDTIEQNGRTFWVKLKFRY